MFDARAPYGISLTDTYIGNTNKIIQESMKVDGYCVPKNEHATSNQ